MFPISFSDVMVRAIREGRKSQTRRLIDAQADLCTMAGPGRALRWRKTSGVLVADGQFVLEDVPADLDPAPRFGQLQLASRWCSYHHGATLWVREAFKVSRDFDDLGPAQIPAGAPIRYLADFDGTPAPREWGRYRSSRFMPRALHRLELQVTEVRGERLQDISEADAIAEGVTVGGIFGATPRAAYAQLWDELHEGDASDATRWAANPWVWVISFDVTAGGAS